MPTVAMWFLVPVILGIIILHEEATMTRVAGIVTNGENISLMGCYQLIKSVPYRLKLRHCIGIRHKL